MSWLIKNIPNLFTLTNLSLGVLGIHHVLTSSKLNEPIIHYYIFAAAICDLLDGFLARKLKAQSAFGVQLDSLADLITFGVLPTFIYANYIGFQGWGYLLILVPVCSAIRLAIFNIDDSQKTVFKGISTTAHGLFVATIPVLMFEKEGLFASFFGEEPVRLLFLAIFFSWLMVSPLRMISLKFSTLSFKENWSRYLLLLTSLILILTLNYQGAPFIMLIYIVLSAIDNFKAVSGKRHS